MTKVIAQTYSLTKDYRTQAIYALMAASIVMIGLYAMNIYSVVSRTVALEKIEKQTATLSNSVESLDSQYLTLSGKITPDTIHAYGFQPGAVAEFINRGASLGSLAMSGHEL